MRMCQRALTVLALGLPLAGWAQVPVVDGNSGYPSAGYGATGAYAGGGATAPSSAQGELFMQLQQLQSEVSQLRGMLEEQQNEIQRLKQESLDRYQDIDSRLASGAAAAPGAATGNSASAPVVPAAGEVAQQPVSNEPADPEKEKLYYDAAFEQIKNKDFATASQAFNAFLRKYPNSRYAGNAQYWLGEVSLATGDLQGAGQAFAKVSQSYPQHAKVPDSLYKLADVERRLGNNDKAKGILREVISQYPGSSAAQLAQRDLQKL